MITLYGYTILVDLALLAIVIAMFIFAVSIYKGASELCIKEQQNTSKRRKELIESRKAELTKKMRTIKDSASVNEVKAELDKLDNEIHSIEKSLSKFTSKAKSLSARKLVFIPGSLLILSIISSGIAIAVSDTLQIIIWVISLLFLIAGLYFICRCICTIEFFSRFIDLSTLMEQALERHAQKMKPIVHLDIWDFQLQIKHGETQEVTCWVSLKQGATAKNVKLLFYSDNKLEFPEEQVEKLKYKVQDIQNPKYFVHDVGDVDYGLVNVEEIKVKAPEDIGEYPLVYLVRCDEYASKTERVIIKVT